MTPTVLPLTAVSAKDLLIVGGKGANLGEMIQAGFPIPPGFCVTTAAFDQFIASHAKSEQLYARLDTLGVDDVEAVRQIGEAVRETLAAVSIPKQLCDDIRAAWHQAGAEHSYAVRSSATAEDLPDASFAGQQDSYLNVCGFDDLLDKVKRCWISLFTDRAILYRIRSGFSHHTIQLSVVVQRMVLPQVSGILFTADPITGHRHHVSIDASYGLGEALVAGLVNPDSYKINKQTDEVIERQIGDKQMAVRPLPDGGTSHETITGPARHKAVLSDAQAVELAKLGVKIEAHYGRPQDIEWCLEDDRFYIVQSRPITTLYPLPEPAPDDEGLAYNSLRLYFSFGHAQVMTDAMPPMGASLWRILFPFGKSDRPLEENRYVCTAGGRLYIDMTPPLHAHLSQRLLPRALTMADPPSAQIISNLIERPEFERRPPREKSSSLDPLRWALPLLRQGLLNLFWRKPEGTAERTDRYINQKTVEAQDMINSAQPGRERLEAARRLIGSALVRDALPIAPYIVSGILSQRLLLRIAAREELVREAEATMRGLSGNVTTKMDLAVGDLADAARQSPDLTILLQKGEMSAALKTAESDPAARTFRQTLKKFLANYGMRGPSEIDISRPRWSDDPTSLLQMVAGNLGNTESGTHRAHHRQMVQAGREAGEKLATAVNHGLLGPIKARIVRRLVRVGRNQMPLREHPKFLLIQYFNLARKAILEAGQLLHDQNRLGIVEDVWFLSLPELIEAFEKTADDLRPRISRRRADFARYQKLTPPRIITSDGEMPTAKLSREGIPEGALVGTAVSPGIVEGKARVVLDPTKEILRPGEILVAPFTDPGWTPLFINAAGLVMEVGGLMTHGSVVAREYGIPAVVAVLDATKQIQTGQPLRLNGDTGYIELLE